MGKERQTIMERFRFTDGAEYVNLFLQAILAQHKRRQWDRSVIDLRIVKPVVNRNMLVLEELSNEFAEGYTQREALLKRFIFKDEGRVFVYTSSTPDEIHSDEESGRDEATRYTLIYCLLCFKREGQDLVLERIRQIDFREEHSENLMQHFLNRIEAKALYWQEDLTQKVHQPVLSINK